ncbi:alpha amylase C-terminal domain-containing protein [Carboxylicivirga sp. A043]|uniref:alpha amylase C-terminal domain-containing protein n=1 Tax=Carboxylicivirga litoralis TaxID=2816963 RepID=UPI0021CAFFA7|nr:alpha amylase C-terminal domain-containing protein [Carboxylicivirga sp. A043]MCU4155612.1 alpha amylase C-terminal domain-containing protein [Carboxylicivirga sp. A043]
MPNHIAKIDAFLEPYRATIDNRVKAALEKEDKLIDTSLYDFANGYQYFGLHLDADGWVIREWAPHASAIYLIGDFSNWEEDESFLFNRIENDVFELHVGKGVISHQMLYKLKVVWPNGSGERIPVWATRLKQDETTKLFTAQLWNPDKPYEWKNDNQRKKVEVPLIYEAHIGMATEKEGVGTYNEFTAETLPRVKKAGYNTIQLMAIQEHPYYGSFGYHVSSLFAPSSRFGTPDELKELIDTAHGMGIAVIMDIVHSHAVKNELEGIGLFDGSPYQFFHDNERREHVAWDSLCYNYAKHEVLHLLLSNVKYWLEEFHFDGYRFDGVTSMLYLDHGLERSFTDYKQYFDGGQDEDALTYLLLANKLMKQCNQNSISIAEEMSGYPGLATPIEQGGIGFDYRLAMGTPDFWIKLIKEQKDEEWSVGHIFYELSNKRTEEKTISYAESHDQALVGDQTIIFRLVGADMYWAMSKNDTSLSIDRGIALHKIIRLLTFCCAGNGYLNFMGNEFGHPEWIDFPREGNNWSYKYARRQWSLVDNPELRFVLLDAFDKAMIALQHHEQFINEAHIDCLEANDGDQVLAIRRKNLLFVFNLNPTESFTFYGIPAAAGKYNIILNSDDAAFGGFNRVDESIDYYTRPEAQMSSRHRVHLYLPNRTALVLKHTPPKSLF